MHAAGRNDARPGRNVAHRLRSDRRCRTLFADGTLHGIFVHGVGSDARRIGPGRGNDARGFCPPYQSSPTGGAVLLSKMAEPCTPVLAGVMDMISVPRLAGTGLKHAESGDEGDGADRRRRPKSRGGQVLSEIPEPCTRFLSKRATVGKRRTMYERAGRPDAHGFGPRRDGAMHNVLVRERDRTV